MRAWHLLIVMAALLGAGVSACANVEPGSGQEALRPHGEGPASPSTSAAAQEAAAQLERVEASPRRPGSYRLQLGDEMDVSFYRTPELNTHAKVRPDGKITLPFVGDVRVLDLEPPEVARLLEDAYAGELRAPRIAVNVTKFGGQRVYIGGEVMQPGVVALSGPLTALQAIQQAGGFRETASIGSVVLIRRSGAKAQGVEVDLSEVVSGDAPEMDPLLQPYDIVYVPRTYIADVDIFVDQYIRKILPMNPSFGIGLGAF